MSEPTVPVQYDCRCCSTKDAVVQVPERYADEDILPWVNLVMVLVGRYHRHYSPHCASSVVDLKIPLPPNHRYIGEAVRQ